MHGFCCNRNWHHAQFSRSCGRILTAATFLCQSTSTVVSLFTSVFHTVVQQVKRTRANRSLVYHCYRTDSKNFTALRVHDTHLRPHPPALYFLQLDALTGNAAQRTRHLSMQASSPNHSWNDEPVNVAFATHRLCQA